METTRTADVEPEVNQPGLRELREAVANHLRRRLPGRASLRDDGIAGLNSAVSSVPDGMASGILVGVNPIYGLYACMVGPIAGGVFSSTRLMIIATTSAASLSAGQALGGLQAEARDSALFLMVVLMGALQVLFGLLRLGQLTRFVSYSVMTGFIIGIAVLTILSQLPTVSGYEPAAGNNKVTQTLNLLSNLTRLDLWSLAVAVITLVLAILLPRTRLGNFGRLAAQARGRVRSYFPGWQVRAEVLEGSPSRELLREAEEWQPDLVVVGSRGRSALGRFFLGSVSQKLATESGSSVRVARRTAEKSGDEPARIMLGVDGSPGAERAVRAVGRRVWREGAEVRVVAVDDGVWPARIAHLLPAAAATIRGHNEEAAAKARRMAEWAETELRAIGLPVSVAMVKGEPQRILVEEALKWGADSIFVGSHGLDRLGEKTGLGGVSTGLVTKAHCSVEVVR